MHRHHHHHSHQHQQHHSRHQQRRRTNMPTGGMFLQDAWMSLTQNLQMQSINSYQHLSTQYIDQFVDIEVKRLKANCKREEDRYVEQMLLENPIIVERRTLSPAPASPTPKPTPPPPQPATRQSASVQSTQSPAAATDATPKTNDNNYQLHSTGTGCSSSNISSNNRHGNKEEWSATMVAQAQERQLLQQRAESCRRSRINNKIKKAKMKFRHKFMSSKLMQSVRMLECIQKLIDQTETQLMSQGFTGQQLEKMKEIFFSGRL